jgi:nitrogen fixation/metabolism regulation signal transduction histidine kinase
MNKNFIFLSLSVILCLLIVSLIKNDFYLGNNSQEKNLKKFEKQLHKKEEIAEKYLNKLIAINQNTFQNDFDAFKKELPKTREKDISYYVYKKDSLIFWSDNYFPIPLTYNEEFFENKNLVRVENGWYVLKTLKTKQKVCIAAILVKSEYKYENDYLLNEINPDLINNNQRIDLSDSIKNAFIVKNKEGRVMFSLVMDGDNQLTENQEIFIFLFYFLVFVFVIFILYYLHKQVSLFFPVYEKYYYLGFVLDMFIFRGILFYFKVPHDLYQTKIFSPVYYASSELLPSFGDLILNVCLFLIASYIIYKKSYLLPQKIIIKKIPGSFIVVLLIAFSGLIFMKSFGLINKMVVDSTISFNLNQIFSLNGFSLIGLLLISFIALSCVLLTVQMLRIIQKIGLNYYVFAGILTVTSILLATAIPETWQYKILILSVFAVYYLVFMLIRQILKKNLNYYEILFYLILFSGTATYIVSNSNTRKELEKRKVFAMKLSSGEDILAENMFKDVIKNITTDKNLKSYIKKYPESETQSKDYILKKYFSGYWSKYKIQITMCSKNDSLMVETALNKTNCIDFFNELKTRYGKTSTCDNLFLLNYGTSGNHYLSEFRFRKDTSDIHVFVELTSKFILKGLGYPELLIDKKHFINADLSDYSYARYYNNNLVDAYGKHYYTTKLKIENKDFKNGIFTYDKNGYNHLCYQTDPAAVLIISKKNGSITDSLAPFSILFTIFSLILFFCFLILNIPFRKDLVQINFKKRLQISIISIIMISFIVIGLSTYYFIRNLNEQKNMDLLSEKTMSILIELQHKIPDGIMSEEQLLFISNALVKFSNVFFTDINLFDTNGTLIASSRPQVYEEGLISRKMNTTAFFQLTSEKKTLFIQKENIGKLEYYSAYMPYYNRDNKLLYFINLPYFAKENELKKELSSFLMAFINIYVFLIAISVLLALIIAERITRPLNVIRDKISHLKLIGKNEKIYWSGHDEIGSLVTEYNRMIDELEKSAEMLSRSEREGAWRVMAMQVAHEIKNPLTPMKLSVQYLEKAWKEKAPDLDNKMERFTKNIVEQIENLSVIASEFSYFAQMPQPHNEKVDIIKLIKDSISMFDYNMKINIFFDEKDEKKVFVLVDKRQMMRVMNNLLVNAFQAIGNKEKGKIEIYVKLFEGRVRVSVEDNGEGISDEMKQKIFTPYFSTKSEGMGLGLAIVKGIIENFKGTVWFESEINTGTTFYFEVPQYME